MFCPFSGGSHLSTYYYVFASLQFALQSSPTKFGFLACGVYRVPLFQFPKRLRHCDTFKDLLHSKSLRSSYSRQFYLPDLIYSISTNTTTIADCASMDFPLAEASGCPSVKIPVCFYKLPVQV